MSHHRGRCLPAGRRRRHPRRSARPDPPPTPSRSERGASYRHIELSLDRTVCNVSCTIASTTSSPSTTGRPRPARMRPTAAVPSAANRLRQPTDRLRRGRAPTSDLGVRNSVRGPQQRLGLAHLPSRRGVRTSKPLQLSPLSTRHFQSPSRSHHPTHTTTDHYLSDTSPVYPIGGTLAKCDPFGTPSTSHWTGAAIIVQSPRTKTCIVTRSRTSTRPMPFSLAG